MPYLEASKGECAADVGAAATVEVKLSHRPRRKSTEKRKRPFGPALAASPERKKAFMIMEGISSVQQPSTSISMISTSSASLKDRKRLLYQKDFVLDLENQRNREQLKKEIEKLGGRVVETIDEKAKPFCLVSDYHCVSLLERNNSNAKKISNLPMLLRDAIENGIRIRSYSTFQQSLTNLKNKIRNEKKMENAPVKLPHSQNNGARKLSSPFMKLEDNSQDYAPFFKEFTSTRFFEPIYLGKMAGKSIFHKITPEMAERRLREEKEGKKRSPRWKSRLGSGYCDICAHNYSNLQLHFTTDEHRRRVSQPSFYDRVDALCGSFTPDIVVPNIPLLKRKRSPSPEAQSGKRCWKYDSE